MKELEDILGIENVKYNELMSKHTSFKVGGPAEIFATVNSIEKLEQVISICNEKNIKMTVIGNGSNILVSDEGIKGVIIKYTANNIEINDENVIVDSGAINAIVAMKALENSLTGLEFAAGIPGTIGGTIYMNAGAFGSEMKDIVTSVKFYDINDNTIKELSNEKIKFKYRHSDFENMNVIILSAKLKLKAGNKNDIETKMKEYKEKRISTQPTDMPSAGSTFKRGEDFIAAKLIDEAGLKGYAIGGAQVSSKHAGFIVNMGNASAKDIMDLINYCQKVVFEKYGKKIETEVRIIK